jgi:gliding motility-associated protein GldM
MSIPKEPRQLMINIMYLVLTALLALNVSAEVLNAFKTVEKGIKNSKEAVNAKNDLVYNALAKAATKDGREESLALIDKADKARKYRKEFVEYIDGVKAEMIEASGGTKTDSEGHEYFVGKKDVETTTLMFVNEGKGDEIEQKINEYRDLFLALLSPEEAAEFKDKLTLKTEKPEDPTLDWKTAKFRKVPVQAVHTILTGIQADAYNAESTILDVLSKKVGAEDVKVDQFQAFAVSESKYLVTGKEFTADIFLGATSKQIRPEIYVGNHTNAVIRSESEDGKVSFERLEKLPADQMPLTNAEPLDVVNGAAKFSTVATGSRTIQGVVKVEKPGSDGQLFDFYPFEFSYETFNPGSVVISPTAMNVLYIGVDNPIEITAGNANPSTVRASGCGIKPASGPGKYTANPTGAPRKESITVAGTTNEGDPVNGQMEFRIARIPDPYLYIGPKKGGGAPKALLANQAGVIARNPDFVFDLPYRVASFDMIYAPRSGPVISTTSNNNMFTDEQKTVLGRMKGGDRLFFSNVKVRLPDGTTREVATSFTVL